MGSICGSPKSDEDKTYVHSIFKQRVHQGDMFDKEIAENAKL